MRVFLMLFGFLLLLGGLGGAGLVLYTANQILQDTTTQIMIYLLKTLKIHTPTMFDVIQHDSTLSGIAILSVIGFILGFIMIIVGAVMGGKEKVVHHYHQGGYYDR